MGKNIVNFFEILSLTQNEKAHSEFLAWLLSPYEEHGLGDLFFRKIIEKLNIANIKCDNLNLKVNREYSYKSENDEGFFDIFIRNANQDKDKKFICLIENKINAAETNDQLNRYRDFLNNESSYEGYEKLFIYLKPNVKNCPNDYIGIDYKFIKECIEECVPKIKEDSPCRSLIEQYLEILTKEKNSKDEEETLFETLFDKIIEEYKEANNPKLKKIKDNKYDFYSFEDENNPEFYWAITNDNPKGTYYINICVKPKPDGNPNIKEIERIEENFDWKGKVNISKNGYYWFGEELPSDNLEEKIIEYINKAYPKICQKVQ